MTKFPMTDLITLHGRENTNKLFHSETINRRVYDINRYISEPTTLDNYMQALQTRNNKPQDSFFYGNNGNVFSNATATNCIQSHNYDFNNYIQLMNELLRQKDYIIGILFVIIALLVVRKI